MREDDSDDFDVVVVACDRRADRQESKCAYALPPPRHLSSLENKRKLTLLDRRRSSDLSRASV